MHARDKVIAFVDIVGFSAMVEDAERDGGDYARPFELIAALGSAADSERVRAQGPSVCPHSPHISPGLDFRITQVSDCVVISAEVSPAGAINLVSHCFGIAMSMLNKNALCRGYITLGPIHHSDEQFIGTGYMRAYRAESEVAFLRRDAEEGGTPFIQIDQTLVRYIRDETDDPVREMFARMTHSDGEYTAVYPFNALASSPTAIIGGGHDLLTFREFLRSTIMVREENLRALRSAEAAAPGERQKAKVRHYTRGMEHVVDRLRAKEALVQDMIDQNRVPYGMAIA
jgi:hypothetical protein